jgi:hypothetical protein
MPTPLRVAAEVIVDAEPEVTWRAAVDWPRQHKWIWATRVNGTGIFEIAPRGERSEFRWVEHIRLPVPPAVGALLSRVIVPLAQWGLRSSLRRFAGLLRKPAPQD